MHIIVYEKINKQTVIMDAFMKICAQVLVLRCYSNKFVT